jgi:CRP/FNR family cyclic AMP-dependent transcriptional regulator
MTFLNQTNRIQQSDGFHRIRVSGGVKAMSDGALGKVFKNGETIIRQGDAGNCMYVIQKGEVEVVRSYNGNAVRLAVLGKGDIFGEISLLRNEKRSATVLAIGEVRVVTVDKRVFLKRLQEDLTLAFRIFQTMAARIMEMNTKLVVLQSAI